MPARERASILSELMPPFTVTTPHLQSAPLVLCSPHSGSIYPRRFLEQSRLDPHTLRTSEDCFVDELFRDAASLGAPLIAARFPRAYLDVNREPYELDPELFLEPLPDFANSRSARVMGGLGTLARVVADGEEIYRSRLPLQVAIERVELLHHPFHRALAALLEETRLRFGYAVLIDCHSMPSVSMAPAGGTRPEFVLGDRFGAACDGRLTRCLKEALVSAGYEVHLNKPYAGGYITEHYGRPGRGVHALQIEINRGLYLNEATLKCTDGFEKLKRNLTEVCRGLLASVPEILERRAAAE